MKKIYAAIAIALCALSANAQNNTSLGVRLNAGTEHGGELILGKTYGSHTRLDFGYGMGMYDLKNSSDFITTINQFYNWQTEGAFKWFMGAGLQESVEFTDTKYSAFNIGAGLQTGINYNFSDHFSMGVDVRETCKLIGKPEIANRWNTSVGLRLGWSF